MNYKYKKGQILGKRLKIPRNILKKVYNCTLSFNEFIEYELDDKIPTSCIIDSDRQIVEKFGIDRCKELDWELINKRIYDNDISFRDILMSIDSQIEDINQALYELVKDKIKPSDYSPKMAEIYSDRLFEIPAIENYDPYDYSESRLRNMKSNFNDGEVSLKDVVSNWELFKDKDLSYCLLKDKTNNGITDSDLKQFMTSYGILARLISDNVNVYDFINEITTMSSEEEKEYVKHFTDDILLHNYRNLDNNDSQIKITNEEYKEIFKYSSLEDFLRSLGYVYGYNSGRNIIKELKNLPQDYVFNMSIPFTELLNNAVFTFADTFGLKNIVDFDNDNDHFFTKNNCEMPKLMFDKLLRNNISTYIPKRNTNNLDPCTKDEFYESIRKMIKYRPSDLNYRDITGDFKEKYAELFLSEQAPEELKKLFYTRSITPQLLVEHPEFIKYLNSKDLSFGFKTINISTNGKMWNLYDFMNSKLDFNDTINFVAEYSDIFNIICNRNTFEIDEIGFSEEDSFNEFKKKINDHLKKIIIEKRIVYPKTIPQDFIKNYPSLFLSSEAPKELQEAFYNRTINSVFILSNPTYINYLKNIDLEVVYKYMLVESDEYKKVNLISVIKQTFGESDSFDVMLLYGKYIESIFELNQLQNFRYSSNFSQDDLLDELDKTILQNIIDENMKYDESIPSHFKNNNPTLFLSQSTPQDIKNKFYNREFTLKDFNDNPKLFEFFDKTNIACAFSENMSWIIPLFNDSENFKTGNYNRMKVILAYSKIQDVELQKAFKEYVMEFETNIDVEKIEYVSEILSRLSLSNSSEIFAFRKELATQILRSNNPLEILSKIEDVFIRNNIPTVGKIYSCFEILHPDFQGFNFESSMVSPVLKKSSTMSKKVTVFSDLIKSSFGSNNRSVNTYLKNIEFGSNLYESIKSGQIQFDSLGEVEMRELTTFCSHLATLYNNTMKAKKSNETFKSTGYVLTDVLELSKKLSPDGTLDYNLADRVIRMFCGFTGIDTLEQAKEYIERKVKTADSRNRNASSSDMILKQGDFIKGIGEITYLRNILQNGSVSKEYLGASADSDSTPLDTDISMIMSSEGTIKEKIDKTAASKYGPIWFVLKNDDRFITTRTSSETLEAKRDMSKMEVFYTGFLGPGHYGIRTGFASSEINYIVMDNYDPKVGLEIAMNGFYIPVANKEGKIVFTPKDYDELRTKMSGLSYFDENNYTFSENLITEETEYLAEQIEQSNYEVQAKREKINSVIKKSLEELGLHLKTNIDGDLTEGFVELIDTGSTGRGTNKPGDGDFDFMMRLDKTILSNPSRLNELKQTILRNLDREKSSELTGTGDFRLKSVQIDSDMSVDIDITFTEKTDKVSYSTDMALQDRLATIQRNDPEKYKYVVANILLAKQVLKKAEVYKPDRGEIPQGGLGGVGIENWILQNGGSFIDAARSFVEAADGKSFSEFQSTYQIWDFGDNHLAERRGQYAHDNFVANNMSEAGYKKMVQALKEYLKTIQITQTKIGNMKR